MKTADENTRERNAQTNPRVFRKCLYLSHNVFHLFFFSFAVLFPTDIRVLNFLTSNKEKWCVISIRNLLNLFSIRHFRLINFRNETNNRLDWKQMMMNSQIIQGLSTPLIVWVQRELIFDTFCRETIGLTELMRLIIRRDRER